MSVKKRVGYSREKARRILTEYFVKKPPLELPIPISKIAEYHGFEIYELDNLSKHHRALKMEFPSEKRKLIGLNRGFHRHSHRFSIGHEMGHYFLEHPPEDDCSDDLIRVYNQEADEFSAELLMPVEPLKKELSSMGDLGKIARMFDVSQQALWIRVVNQGLLGLLQN